jgi:hypothetical protein
MTNALCSLQALQVSAEPCLFPAITVIFPLLLRISSNKYHFMSFKGAVIDRKDMYGLMEETLSLEGQVNQ